MASQLNNEERLKVLSFLPPYEGKSVLELGAGLGHFTGELAKKACKVIALDSVESVVKDNESINGHHENVEFMCAGVTSPDLNFPPETVDFLPLLTDQSLKQRDTTKEFVAKLDLKPGQKVLDVGCGIGGSDFYMAENFGVEVVGIDLSVNMFSLALERAIGLECAVEFEVADCTKKSFDVIYSRDTILHIQDKPALFQTFYKWLKPGGKVLISDYCRKFGTPSEDFAEYIKQRGYDLHDVESYGQMLRDAGFKDVTA